MHLRSGKESFLTPCIFCVCKNQTTLLRFTRSVWTSLKDQLFKCMNKRIYMACTAFKRPTNKLGMHWLFILGLGVNVIDNLKIMKTSSAWMMHRAINPSWLWNTFWLSFQTIRKMFIHSSHCYYYYYCSLRKFSAIRVAPDVGSMAKVGQLPAGPSPSSKMTSPCTSWTCTTRLQGLENCSWHELHSNSASDRGCGPWPTLKKVSNDIQESWSSGNGRRLMFPKVVSSNPGTIYWMEIFHIYLS